MAKKRSKVRQNNRAIQTLSRRMLRYAALAVLFMGLAVWGWLTLPLDRSPGDLDVHVSTGQGARAIAEELRAQGLMVNPNLFVLVARFSGVASQLKAGRYEIPQGLSTLDLANLLSKGSAKLSSIALVEGFNARELLAKLRAHPDLVDDYEGLDERAIAQRMNLEGGSLEGWIYPDTYRFSPGSKLSSFLARATRLQQQVLTQAWSQRVQGLPLNSPYEALVLASIVEKETGRAQDRPKVASVFVNRLRLGMMLQTDPTVIYGVGPEFDGNLTRKHLQTDTPYNSYTRTGLPPTPIANPGKAALFATVRPEETRYLYFVAKGDGSSHFSKDLNEHNNAVRKYQLGR